MHIGSIAIAAGADFRLMGPRSTELRSSKPSSPICAVRTGSGKSQTTRHVASVLREAGKRVAVLRHPMPYGDLTKQAVQRFERYEDLDAADATIEEREEYEPHLAEGNLVFAGIDYGAILERAEQEADVVVWDGGNNDIPFIRPDLHLVVVDPHRPGHELRYHPGETNLRMADACVVNKIDTAPEEGVEAVLESIRSANPDAAIVRAASPFEVEGHAPDRRQARPRDRGRADAHPRRDELRRRGARGEGRRRSELVDPRPFAVGSIKETFAKYPHVPSSSRRWATAASRWRSSARRSRARRRPRPHRDADRPPPGHRARQAGSPGHLPPPGDRRADDRGPPRERGIIELGQALT